MPKTPLVKGQSSRRSSPYGNLDGRSADGRLLRRVREQLTEHLGPSPSAVQLALVQRAAWLTLHMATMDARIATGGALSEHDGKQYLAWSNSLSKTLRHLGLKGDAKRGPTLAEHLAHRATAA